MDFRVEHEIRVIRKVVKHVHGPCLICDGDTEYGERVPRLGMGWLRKQFEPDSRRRNTRAVRIGVAPKNKSLPLLEALLCETCQAGLPTLRQDASGEREAELQRRAQLSQRYHIEVEAEREREGRGWAGELDIS
ncbi:MAG: hypothetical protein M1482_04030 [Chloroflexi bacterium]|nr:hypothetical protein [Chloroflexota bacterium]